MTRYEQGFMNKCAEYGVDGRALLEKQALLVGGLTGYFGQRGNKDVTTASIGGRKGAKSGLISSSLTNAVLALLLSGNPVYAAGSGLLGAGTGALGGYLGGRLAGHRNAVDLANGKVLV